MRTSKTLRIAIPGHAVPPRHPDQHSRSYSVDPETIVLLRPVVWLALAATCLCIYLFTTPACDRLWRACGGDWTRAKELPERPAGTDAGGVMNPDSKSLQPPERQAGAGGGHGGAAPAVEVG